YLVRRARKELSTEINAAAHAGKSTEFRPLMPRSLRGGEDGVGDQGQATPATASAPIARPDDEAQGADSSTPNLKANAGGESDAGGGSGGARSTEPEVHAPGRENECRDSRMGEASESVALPESRGGGTKGGAAAGSTSFGAEIDPARNDGDTKSASRNEKPVATVGGGISDTHDGGDDATADDTTSGSTVAEAATVAAVAAAGVMADAAADPDARMLSGCTVSFRCEDFVAEAHGDHGYDVVCLFSVVKWMHINGGDEALRGVFRKTYSLL
ncbi:unnamed protein product, partial [Ectocarpus sp. 8 AP-2014]